MKKTVKIISIVCMIAMLIGILPVMSVSATDPATLVVTPSSETVKAGREFTVTVSLKNNPGVWSVKFNLAIDANAFEFVSDGSDAEVPYAGTILASGDGMSGYDAARGYTFNRTYSDKFNNATADGALVVLTLRAKADATLDTYTFAATVDAANTINVSTAKVAIADASADVEVIFPTIESTIDSADLMLGTDISVEYYATLDPTHVGAQMRFTMNDNEYVVDGTATGVAYEYVYVFTGVAPQCMGDNIVAELVVEGEVVATKDEYSVLEYCNNMLSKDAAALELTEAQYAAMETLIADLLVYGAKAQLYRGYKTTALVDAGVTGSDFVAPENLKYTEESNVDGLGITSIGVYFDYTNALFVKFTAVDMAEEDFRIVLESDVTGDEFVYTLADCDVIDEATSTYFLKMADVPVTAYDDLYIITVQTPRSATRWNDNQIIEYSVGSYVYAMQNSENAAMVELSQALYTYGTSAVAYDAVFNG